MIRSRVQHDHLVQHNAHWYYARNAALRYPFPLPLKHLMQDCVIDIATWVLRQTVTAAAPLLTALLPGQDPLRVDQLFQVTLADARTLLFHIEFREPMPPRMLTYMIRMAGPGPDFLRYNVVMYIGRDTGKEDGACIT